MIQRCTQPDSLAGWHALTPKVGGHESLRRSYRIFAFLVLSAMAIHTCPTIASAQETTQQTATQAASVEDGKIASTSKDSSNSESYGAWGRLLAAMAVVVVLIVALGWLVKRLGAGKALRTAGPLQLIARTNLSPKHQMFLVRMGSRLVLIGAGPQGLATLSEITDTEEANQLLQATGLNVPQTEGGEA